MYTTASYLIYLILSIAVTITIQRTLSRNGFFFLVDGFGGDMELARSTNHLLSVGFYLLNLGFVLLRMDTQRSIDTVDRMIVYLTSNMGVVLVILGILHFFNMIVIQTISRSRRAVPPRSKSYAELADEEARMAAQYKAGGVEVGERT
ncbi:MAG: hypothetical protein AAFX85_17060 [Pseudomonadota bacterium]